MFHLLKEENDSLKMKIVDMSKQIQFE